MIFLSCSETGIEITINVKDINNLPKMYKLLLKRGAQLKKDMDNSKAVAI